MIKISNCVLAELEAFDDAEATVVFQDDETGETIHTLRVPMEAARQMGGSIYRRFVLFIAEESTLAREPDQDRRVRAHAFVESTMAPDLRAMGVPVTDATFNLLVGSLMAFETALAGKEGT